LHTQGKVSCKPVKYLLYVLHLIVIMTMMFVLIILYIKCMLSDNDVLILNVHVVWIASAVRWGICVTVELWVMEWAKAETFWWSEYDNTRWVFFLLDIAIMSVTWSQPRANWTTSYIQCELASQPLSSADISKPAFNHTDQAVW